jgi:hypothetical protein
MEKPDDTIPSPNPGPNPGPDDPAPGQDDPAEGPAIPGNDLDEMRDQLGMLRAAQDADHQILVRIVNVLKRLGYKVEK